MGGRLLAPITSSTGTRRASGVWTAPRHRADMLWLWPGHELRAPAALNAPLSNFLRGLRGRYRLPSGLMEGCRLGKKWKLLTFCSGMNEGRGAVIHTVITFAFG